MPLSVRVVPEQRLVWLVGSGVVTDEELLAYVEEYLEGKGLGGYDELVDLRGADLLGVSVAGLSRVAERAAGSDPGSRLVKVALLVEQPLALGLSRLYQGLREAKGGSRLVRVFLQEEEALDWLGLREGGPSYRNPPEP